MLLETDRLPMKKDTLDKVRKQLAGISALVDFGGRRCVRTWSKWSCPRGGHSGLEHFIAAAVLARATVHTLCRAKGPDCSPAPGLKKHLSGIVHPAADPELPAGWKKSAGEPPGRCSRPPRRSKVTPGICADATQPSACPSSLPGVDGAA